MWARVLSTGGLWALVVGFGLASILGRCEGVPAEPLVPPISGLPYLGGMRQA